MARSFDQILADVTAQSDPQRQVILNQIADLPNQQASAESGLTAQKDQAYQDILSGAQQRGLGFSGIPLSEQAKYDATNYAPALANLKSTYANNKNTLESALAGVGQNNYQTARGQYNTEQALAEQQRQFNENLALQKQQAGAQSASNQVLASLLAPQPTQPSSVPAPALPTPQQQSNYNFVRHLIDEVQGGNGNSVSLILNQAKHGDPNSISVMRAFYQLQNRPVPANFRSFLGQ